MRQLSFDEKLLHALVLDKIKLNYFWIVYDAGYNLRAVKSLNSYFLSRRLL